MATFAAACHKLIAEKHGIAGHDKFSADIHRDIIKVTFIGTFGLVIGNVHIHLVIGYLKLKLTRFLIGINSGAVAEDYRMKRQLNRSI